MQILVFFEHPVQQPKGNNKEYANVNSNNFFHEFYVQYTTLPEPGSLVQRLVKFRSLSGERGNRSPLLHTRVPTQ